MPASCSCTPYLPACVRHTLLTRSRCCRYEANARRKARLHGRVALGGQAAALPQVSCCTRKLACQAAGQSLRQQGVHLRQPPHLPNLLALSLHDMQDPIQAQQ
jgi:hypothetical protein